MLVLLKFGFREKCLLLKNKFGKMAKENMTYADIMWKLHEGWTLYETYVPSSEDLSRPHVLSLVYSIGKGDERISVSLQSARDAMGMVELHTCEKGVRSWEHTLSAQDSSMANLIDFVDDLF